MTSTWSNNDIGVFDSRAQFENSVQDLNIPGINPRYLDEIINVKKEVYSKLKFQYLEQETKEKFLRLIIDNKPIYIDEKDLDHIASENIRLKAELKQAKVENETILENVISMSSDVFNKASELTALSNSNEELMCQIAEMTGKIEELTEANGAKEREFNMDVDDSLIMQINECNNNNDDDDLTTNISIANSVSDLKTIIDGQSAVVESVQADIANRNEEIKAIRSRIDANGSKLIDLRDEKASLTQKLNDVIESRQSQLSDSEDLPEFMRLEKMGKELSTLISVWMSLTPFKIEFDTAETGDIVVCVNEAKLTIKFFDDHRARCLKILAVEGMDVEENFIETCNYHEDCIGYFIKQKFAL